jgi:ubiquinone/menaquinone biosynthesis C-methylase UbiE
MSDYDAHYRRGGFGYDKDVAMWRPWVQQHYVQEFDLKPGTKLLDVGCGDGFWAMLLDELGVDVTGVDVAEGGVEVARTRPVERAEFVVCDIAEPLPFPAGTFDVAFMRGLSLFHDADPHERAHQLGNVVSVVRPGGMLLVSINTTRTGTIPEGASAYHHRVSTLFAVLERFGQPARMARVGNYFQFAVTAT